jgi:hypothetical protein
LKRAVSVSLGTSRRDFTSRVRIAGREVEVRRIGCDGSVERLAALLRELDGRVEAIGLGGLNFAYRVAGRSYPVPQAARLRRLVRGTPLVDGSFLKDTLERWVVGHLEEEHGLRWRESSVLVASVLDRFGLAEEMHRRGARVLAGDVFFALHLPGPFLDLGAFGLVARALLPALRLVPLTWLYPLGAEQDRPGRAGLRLKGVQVLAGDCHLLLHRLPEDLRGRMVLVNSLWPEEERLLRARGAAGVATTMPPVEGRSWSANAWEAALHAALGDALYRYSGEGLARLLMDAGLRPKVEVFRERQGFPSR